MQWRKSILIITELSQRILCLLTNHYGGVWYLSQVIRIFMMQMRYRNPIKWLSKPTSIIDAKYFYLLPLVVCVYLDAADNLRQMFLKTVGDNPYAFRVSILRALTVLRTDAEMSDRVCPFRIFSLSLRSQLWQCFEISRLINKLWFYKCEVWPVWKERIEFGFRHRRWYLVVVRV